MATILYWNEHEGATIVCNDGHVMLRKIPLNERPLYEQLIKDYQDSPDVTEKITVEQMAKFLKKSGLTPVEGTPQPQFGPMAAKPKRETPVEEAPETPKQKEADDTDKPAATEAVEIDEKAVDEVAEPITEETPSETEQPIAEGENAEITEATPEAKTNPEEGEAQATEASSDDPAVQPAEESPKKEGDSAEPPADQPVEQADKAKPNYFQKK